MRVDPLTATRKGFSPENLIQPHELVCDAESTEILRCIEANRWQLRHICGNHVHFTRPLSQDCFRGSGICCTVESATTSSHRSDIAESEQSQLACKCAELTP